MTQLKLHRFIEATLGLLLVMATFYQEYSYYRNLKIFVFLGGLYLIYFYRTHPTYKIALVTMTVLFNPILIVTFARHTWTIIDLFFAFFLGYLFWFTKR